MTDGRIAGYGFHLCHGGSMRAAEQRPFNPAMLISQNDFQMKDGFAMTLETEMPRFDNSGMYRSDRYFMNFGSQNPIKFSHAGQDGMLFCSSPGIMAAAAGPLVTDRLEPRVVIDRDTALLGNLTFEQVCFGAGGSYAGEAVLDP
jgi:hypothetical protein